MTPRINLDWRICRTRGTNRAVVVAASVMTVLLFSAPADAQRRERSGKEVVDTVCAACHAEGTNGAPRIGDEKAWTNRASQGLSALSEHALKGIRKMPAHGGNAGLSDIEIERAITHMVNQSGGNWVEPLGGATPAVVRTSAQIVQTQCAKCHQQGLNGAPKIGDRNAWIPRLKKGLDVLVRSAIHGHGPMPARGGLPDLSDTEIRGAITYMFSEGTPAAQARATSPAKGSDPYHQVVSGTEIYLGIVPAQAMSANQPQGKTPTGKGYYHINISLFDSKTKVPVTDAQVKVRVADMMQGETRTLEMISANNTISYGSYFRMLGRSPYTITAQIERPGAPGTIEAKFEYRVR